MEAERLGSVAGANKLWKVGAYVCVLTAASLRGHEGFYLDLAGMRTHMSKGTIGTILLGLNKSTVLTEEVCLKLPHITICLLGKFKGETGVDQHLITVANETSPGLQPRWWMEKLVQVCKDKGRFKGPAFATLDEQLAASLQIRTEYSGSTLKWYRRRPTSSLGTIVWTCITPHTTRPGRSQPPG
jgi:hypothetical protein